MGKLWAFALVATLLSFGMSCAKKATSGQLVKRASFDLSCPAESIEVIPIDDLTKGARGCGKQATYVEVCDGPKNPNQGDTSDTKCTWMMNVVNDGQPVDSSSEGASPGN